MKKSKLILSIAMLLAINLSAQPFGESLHTLPGTVCSDGKKTQNQDGFLIAGYVPTIPAGGGPTFYIERTDIGGAYNGNTWEFTNTYTVNYNLGTCANTGYNQAPNCYGVTVIETALSTPTRSYVVVGATDEGCFFSVLNPNGTSATDRIYRFPANITNPTKPLIVETSTSGVYIICGSYATVQGNFMYVMRVNALGLISFSYTYRIAGDLSMIPYGMVLSPYASEVVIVGKCKDYSGNAGFDSKAFFLQLDESNLSSNGCTIYGENPTPNGTANDYFTAITIANGTYGGTNGFAIAGYSEYQAPNGFVWNLKVDPNGKVIWNKITGPTADNAARYPAGIVERFSGYATYPVYTAVSSTAGIIVIKLEEDGTQYNPLGALDKFSEFVYNSSGGGTGSAAAISKVDNGAPTDRGIQVYGTGSPSGGSHYFIQAHTNGYTEMSTCVDSYITNFAYQGAGPTYTSSVGAIDTTGLTRCVNISVGANAATFALSTLCFDPNPNTTNGSLIGKLTGVSKIEDISSYIDVGPNPTSDLVSFNATENTELVIVNSLGQLVWDSREQINEIVDGRIQVSLKQIGLTSGIYFLTFKDGNTTSIEKLILE